MISGLPDSPATRDPNLPPGDRPDAPSGDRAPLPAGGPDPHRFDWAEAWYPVAYLQDLDRDRPTPFTLLGLDLVLWYEPATQRWSALENRCPHRLAPLSEGRINLAGQLECPYHGWAFSGGGRCETIPQAPEGNPAADSPRACARALPTAEAQGLLFVYRGTPERADRVAVPVVEPLVDDPEGWVCLDTFRDLPYDALTLLENVLDASHIPYTHHRSVGNRENAAPMEMGTIAETRQGFRGLWPEGPRRGKLGTQHTTFLAPGLMWHDLTSKQFGRTLTVVYATPIRKGECRLFARFPFQFASKIPALAISLTPRWWGHLGQNGVLEDDQIFLHWQERFLAAAGGSDRAAQAFYLPTQADRYVLALHRWVREYDAEPFPGEPLPPRQDSATLLDRYRSHTQQCRSCRRALQTVRRLRVAAVVLAIAAIAAVPWVAGAGWGLKLALSAAIALAAAAWTALGRLERQFYDGREIPPRNRPEKS